MSEVSFDDLLNGESAPSIGPPDDGSRAGRGSVSSTTSPSPSPAASAARSIVGRGRVRKTRLKGLTQKHKLMIGLHLQGLSHRRVAEIVGCSVSTVVSVVGDPLAQEVIAHYYEGVESELKALFPKAVGAVRDALDSKDIDKRMKGVDRYAKLAGVGEEKSTNVTVNVVQNARERFVGEVRAAAERAGKVKELEGQGNGIIEGEVEEL